MEPKAINWSRLVVFVAMLLAVYGLARFIGWMGIDFALGGLVGITVYAVATRLKFGHWL